jgi:DNA-binding PadR family transcriptional regulator
VELEGFTLNKELKNLGHGVSNITSALDTLMSRKPALVIQTKKSGTSKQARKKYKLTLEGLRAVERMVS